MDRFAKQFGLRVKRARAERGLTQLELASLAEVGANYVPRIERGEMTPSVDAAYRIAQSLGTSVDALCSSNTRPEPLQEAVRLLMSLTEMEISAFRRTVGAVESLRLMLRGGRDGEAAPCDEGPLSSTLGVGRAARSISAGTRRSAK